MDKFLSSHFDSESPEYYPEDFQGAAPGDGVIYISSDDDMECASSASVDDLESLSDDDEVALLAQCVERQMELPATSESIPIPSTANKQEVTRAATPKLAYIPGPMFDAGYFDLGMGRGPIVRDPRLRNDHPINLCSQLIPMVDTPMSPPARDEYPSGDWRKAAEATTSNSQQHSNGIHFRDRMAETTPISQAVQIASFVGNPSNKFRMTQSLTIFIKRPYGGNQPNSSMQED